MDEARDNIMDHYEYPRNHGALPDATVVQRQDNPLCGDRVVFYLQLVDDTVAAIGWEGRGCTISQAAASMLSEELLGKSITEARALDEQFMVDLIGTRLNPARMKCATLGLKAVQHRPRQPGKPIFRAGTIRINLYNPTAANSMTASGGSDDQRP